MSLSFSPAARRQVLAADSWWRRHRAASPELFTDEVEATVSRVLDAPRVGRLYGDVAAGAVRRVLMPATRHHVYCQVTDATLTVLAVWSARRGRTPPL